MSRSYRSSVVVVGICLALATMTLSPVVAGASGPATAASADTAIGSNTDSFEAVTGSGIEPRQPQVSAAVAEERVVPTTIEIERLNGTDGVQFTYTFDLPGDTTLFDVESISPDDGYSVVATTGFEDGQQLSWDTETTAPSITVEHMLPNDTNGGMHRVDTPRVYGSIQRGDSPKDGHVDAVYNQPVGFHLDTSVRVSDEGRYVAGEVILGEYSTYTETADGKNITLFVPNEVDMAVSPEEAITAAAATDHTIEGDPHRDVYLFVLEGQIAAGGASGSTAVVHAGSPLGIYVHETAHINEGATFGKKIAWFTEASATYYGKDFQVADGELRIKRAKLLERTDPDGRWPRGGHHNNSTLAEPSTWGHKTDYQKGSRLLFALDAKLREATDGEATIHDVMRRVNQYDERYGALTYTDFREIIVDLADEETASWLDPYVLTSQNPPQPNASAFGPPPKFADETTDLSGDASEAFEFAINLSPGEQPGPASVTLAIDAGETTVEAVATDGNDDGRVTVRFQPYGPNGETVLEPTDPADEVTVTEGTVADPVVSESIRVDLLLTDTSGSHRVSTMSIRLESIPTALGSTPTDAPASTPESDPVSEFVSEVSSDLSTTNLVVGIPFALAALLVAIKGR
ncbi:hypothetical protein [Halobellus captivus]|uniref:hypothetical protein n=1 Tax=Halobellus captivus TaxID=2592614 RepID=UPI0011A7693D|nr:hypothetical protein [Halobellus captivus]